ncbi:SAYSvFN domain-containing protein, partial [Haematococcus lacustris]
MRMLMLVLFCVGCLVSSKLQLGPVFILLCIITAIVTNLGQKKEGEVSAYSICNPGVERLPGQLDADDVDQQIRRGQI